MNINVDAEREAVARLLHRWHCEAEPGWDSTYWEDDTWDVLQTESEREEYRRKAMVLMDAMVGALTVAWQRLDESDDALRTAVRYRNLYADALGEALEIFDTLFAGHDDQRALYADKLAYFETLWEEPR